MNTRQELLWAPWRLAYVTQPKPPAGSNPCFICRGLAEHDDRGNMLVTRTERSVVYLNRYPYNNGHLLVAPRAHVPTLLELPDTEAGPLFIAVRRLAAAVERGLGADGTFVAMNNKVSQSVPHLHVHIVPRRRKDGLRGFFWPRTTYGSEADATAVAERIRAALMVEYAPGPDA